MKNRHRFLTLRVVGPGLLLLASVAAGCGGTTDTATPDLASGTGSLTLKNVPTGCPATETAADLYTTVVANTCAVNGCHGTNGTSFQLSSAADLHAKWVGQKSTLYSGLSLPLVTAGNLSQSFVLYKLTGSQGQYGSQMPSTGIPLTTAQLCKFVAWINSGAN